MKETNISDWRRGMFGDLTSAFRFHATPEADPPGAAQTPPVQEPGGRKRVP